MDLVKLHSLVVLLCTLSFAGNRVCYAFDNTVEKTMLKVGEELWKESLPLHRGSCLYKLEGLKPYTWYEVKISYPASIPACFSLQLTWGDSDSAMNLNRKLLNTEKIIFKTESLELIQNQGGMHVLVTVEPEGVVAIRDVKERESIIYNIVCDELLLGIPHKAWPVGILVLLCLVVAFIVPSFLPPFLLAKSRSQQELHEDVSKNS
ncbi:uncharacterized protein LOC115674433 [Syzygium oleosum]|uniref:uncharacterized protein LOC115674433 n=1 Tax=Syzygium oleosum TaxID=219896 RepID=UPI0024BA15D6|nr:uncharacterized protein LOC115674433 [Syzygium oleosum]XP_056166631.1 uncharacterized protein LOC115674433 [Syzygium oleosum]XP_056166632.1 uncharacterized protein LOC115674433 [Syzygium oleosum]XP_056166633.1 uncharacterized protein LOC115674433 [Syzygium oleosum]XP_056166634.1 uncharacterized protein LOC115674433 [Syzygium oleosum]XP_056166635.1 uncharacterized protein LOC115674433 [Syzygium oleosum]